MSEQTSTYRDLLVEEVRSHGATKWKASILGPKGCIVESYPSYLTRHDAAKAIVKDHGMVTHIDGEPVSDVLLGSWGLHGFIAAPPPSVQTGRRENARPCHLQARLRPVWESLYLPGDRRCLVIHDSRQLQMRVRPCHSRAGAWHHALEWIAND